MLIPIGQFNNGVEVSLLPSYFQYILKGQYRC
jgi:hypothetical protein